MRSRFPFILSSLVAAFLFPSLALAVADTSMVNLTGVTSTTNKFGRSVVGGDFNGDGYQDLAAGAPNNSSASNYVSIVYGSAATLVATTISTTTASILTSTTTDFFGVSVAAGNFNGDAYDDLIIGAPGDAGGGTTAGAMYIVYGQPSNFTSEAVSADASIIKITGPSASASLGAELAMGDINGDGLDDVVVSAPGANTTAGAIYFLYGSTSAYTTSSIVSYATYAGEASGDSLGGAVAVGEVTGDTYADILVGAAGNDDNGSSAGAVYFLPGQAASFSSASIGTLAEFTGEAAGEQAGTAVAISPNSMNGSSYGALLTTAPGNDDASSSAGAVYMIPGAVSFSGTASLGAAGTLEFTGVTTADSVGNALAVTDFNQDGFDDLAIGSTAPSVNTGVAYILPGSTTLASGSLSSAVAFTSSSSGQNFGKSMGYSDLNGDGFSELLIGANAYSSSVGAAYVGYLYIDADLDGVPGTSGLVGTTDTATSSDCNDADSTVTANQTFYPDVDGDGLGDPAGTTMSVCASTLEGYAGNSSDTDDTIANNGVEIDGDDVDNDGDSEIDEHNTVAENGEHPYYGTRNPANNASDKIVLVEGSTNGQVTVTYGDNSVYDLEVYTSSSTKNTKVEQYKSTGYAVVVKRDGTKAYLLDLYTGDKAARLTLNSSSADSANLLLDDVRNDDRTEAVFTVKKNAKVKVYLVQVKKNSGQLTLLDKITVQNSKVETSETRTSKKTLQLQSAAAKVLITLEVNKNYKLSERAAG